MKKFKLPTAFAIMSVVLTTQWTVSVSAQESQKPLIGVVELFTSQGCSSCPPADAALENFIERGDVLALAYHVPYWDYLGWKDTLASPANEDRQRGYSQTFGARSVYTPQAVINGREHVVGSRANDIDATLSAQKSQGEGLTVPLILNEKDDRIHISVGEGTPARGEDVKLILVYYKDQTTVDISRGENAGEKISYHNTVTETQVLGMWDGQKMDIEIPYSELASKKANGCAILLQAVSANGSPGAILGAAILPRRSS